MSQPEAGPSNTSIDSQGSMPMDITTGSIEVPTQPDASAQAQHVPSSSSADPHPSDDSSIAIEPPQPIKENLPDYDRRTQAVLAAYETAVYKGVNKFTYDDFATALPLQAKQDPKMLKQVYVELGEKLRERILIVGKEVFDAAKGTEGLRAVTQAARRSKDRQDKKDNIIRGDEWILTQGLSPAAMSATFNLPLYDSEHARLTAELAELDASILTAATGLEQLESQRGSVEGITAAQMAEINETVAALERLPTDDLTHWMERILAEGGR